VKQTSQAKAGADKLAGAAKDATGNPGGKLQGAAGDAKSAAGSLKQVGELYFSGFGLQQTDRLGVISSGKRTDKSPSAIQTR